MGDHAMRMSAGRSFASSNPHLARSHWICGKHALLWLAALAIGGVGCGDGEGKDFPFSAAAQGVMVSVDKGDTTVGFARGTTRVSEKTDAFKISKFPVTKKQYKACEAAKICKAPKVDECSDPALARASIKGVGDSAAICVGRENAETYCKWAGGRLPTLAEWLRAARGPGVQEYPWGSTRASCAQHPRSVEADPRVRMNANESISVEGCESQPELTLVTKKHPNGASASGMQDVLIAPAELLSGHEKSPFAVCTKGQQCLVYGLNPGSIDSVGPYTVGSKRAEKIGDESQLRLTPRAYGFRCLVED